MKANILLDIAYYLEETTMSQLLITVYDMPAETPLYDKSIRCQGLMETESRLSRSCSTDVVGLDEENRPYFNYCVTTGGFVCTDCTQNSSQRSRELEILNKLKADGEALSVLQEKRYASLNTRRIFDHNTRMWSSTATTHTNIMKSINSTNNLHEDSTKEIAEWNCTAASDRRKVGGKKSGGTVHRRKGPHWYTEDLILVM